MIEDERNILEVYVNTLFKYSKSKTIQVDGNSLEIHLTLLDKRFITFTHEFTLQEFVPYCTVRNTDKNFIFIYSPNYINYKYLFGVLLDHNLIVSPERFVDITGYRRRINERRFFD